MVWHMFLGRSAATPAVEQLSRAAVRWPFVFSSIVVGHRSTASAPGRVALSRSLYTLPDSLTSGCRVRNM
jgi:hypothetical protein